MLAVIAVLDSGCEKNPIKVHSSEVEEQIEKGGENVVLVPDLGVEERRETATTVPDQGAEAQKEGYEETVVPASDLGVEETIEKCGESAMPVPGSKVKRKGVKKLLLGGLGYVRRNRNETKLSSRFLIQRWRKRPRQVLSQIRTKNRMKGVRKVIFQFLI